uniref:Laminin subunit alpha 3 n=1 Tax=Sander lucioperca TaxID=283035 RepID=A0A8C9ZMT2_SANLU
MARGMRGAHLLAVFFTFSVTIFRDANGQGSFNDLTGFSLSPPYFNLVDGSSISATATCGQDGAGTPRYELYCKLVGGPNSGHPTQNIQGQFCDYCNSIDPNKAHPVNYAIDGTERWWQSPPLSSGLGYNEVNVTLDLGQLFHVAYVLLKFANSPRPDLWVLERSVDNGRTFIPWQYFAHSKRECIEKFGKHPNARIVHDDDQICTTDYSRIVPLENGEIVVSLVNGRPGSKNFTYSPVLQDFTKATNIRLRFLRTNTLLGHLISKAQRDPTVTRRYYYSIKDISIGGRCVCHGHAHVCGGGRNQDNPKRLQCECQHNTCGETCDRCCPGFNQKPWRVATVDSSNECHPCQCFSHAFDCYYDQEVEKRGASLDTFGRYDGGGVCINCQHNTAGVNCEQCLEGFYRPYGVPPESPTGCIPCRCDERTTVGCEMGSGRCICKPQFAGENCDRCAEGYYYYPQCIRYPVYQTTTKSPAGPIVECICDYRGTAYGVCDASGRCLCRQGVEGERCDRCRQGYHSFPNCRVCQCSQEGSYGSICNPLSGQCLCLPGVVGQQCDRCASGLRFPQSTSFNSPYIPYLLFQGSCRCLANVEGTLCDRCKPLYWKLNTDNSRGCIGNGQCHCKPNACGHACDTCKDGYFLLQRKQYLGCQGCQCDVGGAIGMACDEMSGQCWCRKNVVGRECTEPAPSYYFPTLHQLKFEVEDGTTPNARPVRFGYNSQEFPDFSWKGYAVMSPAQSEVRVTVHVDPKDERQHLFRVVLRFTNPSSTSVTGNISACCSSGSDQSKEVIFPKSPSPSFLTVPGEGFAEPFALTPGKWIIHIRAEGLLLDYLVLLPRDYYEAPLLQEKITQPCTYLPTVNRDTNCLLYKHVAMDGFSSALGSQGKLSSRSGRKRRQSRVRRPTPDHPEMAALSGRQVEGLHTDLRVPRPGQYALVLEYASEVDTVQNVNILISGQSGGQIPARANIYSCAYSFLCRSVAVDSSSQVTVLQLTHKTELLLQTSTTSFLLYKVYAVPAEEFSIEYVDPKVLCVSTHGRFTDDRLATLTKPHCMLLNTLMQEHQLFLLFFQTEIHFTPKVPIPGSYVVVVHYHQAEHTSYPVEVRVDAGREWKGSINASFCPAVSGCREVVIADGRIALDFDQNSWQLPTISVIVPPKKTLILVSGQVKHCPNCVYPLNEMKKPLDKSADFIQQCRGEGFFIDLRTSSQFCRDSARSLVAAYNDGALPCNCDKSGSTGTTCDPVGGQCPCRQHVIGRQCTKCATGYYGFPYCRPCECGRRLCDEVTGRCICPPQTVRPACDVCQGQTFSYHPLLGCEGCECSPNGIKDNTRPDCDRTTGQCSCKPRIGGRQCDRCAAGYYRFPDCVPCNCNQGGVTPNICHPDTGRCLCKRNVAGVKCDTCREGSFYFDPSNPHGCTRCFCFGATDQCQSSSKRRGKFVEMRVWRLESPDQEEVTSVLNTASNTVVADIQELPPTVQTLYWVAPSSYLGDRVSSYGGFLTYQSKSFGIPSEGMTLLDRRPDVVLTGHNMTLIHMALQVPLPDRLYQGRVQLLEGNWRHAVSNRPVNREELMMVLAGLVGLRIRALYFTQSQRLSIGEVGLEGATITGTGSPGNTVEDCSCPPQYTGDSCEKCAPGYYRDRSGPFLGRCVPCECNGLADECEGRTGRCLNCQYNTAGDRCERCKEGYYGNAAQRTCRVCPCPFNGFAIGCKEVFGDFECICRAGYTGDKCESCAPGYYGNPLTSGGSCRPCNCNGNGNNCDPRTGECDNCAQTLLQDLEKLDDELGRIKTQLDNATASASSQDRLKKLEKAVSDTKVTCQCTEYEQLAAQLDGAKTDLTKKVNEIAAAAAKEGIVIAAENHAKELSKLAKELEDAVKDASGRTEVRNAKDAIDAYKNITDAINAAEAAANEAKAAADNALNTMLSTYYKLFLLSVKDLLKTIPSLNDKISEVENLTSQVSPFTNISEDIRKIKELIEQARDAANRIVIPMKFTGNGYVEMRAPKNLEDLKAYTALSLSLQRPQGRDNGDMFVMYLGNKDSSKNYIGMVLRSNVLYGFYKLNGVEYEMKTGVVTTSSSEPAKFDRVDLQRIYQDAKMILTKDITSNPVGSKIEEMKQGKENKNLLDLSPSDVVFYVGGYPDSFTPPASLNYPKYQGCIEFSSFNDKVISLYNFQKAEGINTETPCKRDKITMQPFKGCLKNIKLSNIFKTVDDIHITAQTTLRSQLINGCVMLLSRFLVKQSSAWGARCQLTSQALVWPMTLLSPLDSRAQRMRVSFCRTNSWSVLTSILKSDILIPSHANTKMVSVFILSRPHFSLDVRTRAPEGLLFFAATREGRSHLALYISKGRIRLSVGKQKEIFNREKYNDGKWHSVIFSLEKKKFRLVVDGIRAQDGQLTNAELTSMQKFVSPVYLGSAPESLHKELKVNVSGCIRNFKMNGAPISTPTTNHAAGPCFEGQTQRGAYFSGNGAHVIISEYTSLGIKNHLLEIDLNALIKKNEEKSNL